MPDAEPEKPDWEGRRNALHAAQANYLWALLVACLFYAAVGRGTDDLKVPILDVTMSGHVVAMSGPAVIAFLVLVFMGALRATTVAVRKARIESFEGEAFDHHPNALDLAFYTSASSLRLARRAAHFKYPFALTLALAESAWLGVPLFHPRPSVLAFLVGLGSAGLWLVSTALVFVMWRRRFKQIPALLERDRKARGV